MMQAVDFIIVLQLLVKEHRLRNYGYKKVIRAIVTTSQFLIIESLKNMQDIRSHESHLFADMLS